MSLLKTLNKCLVHKMFIFSASHKLDLNGHVSKGNIGDEEIMGRYSAKTRNKK